MSERLIAAREEISSLQHNVIELEERLRRYYGSDGEYFLMDTEQEVIDMRISAAKFISTLTEDNKTLTDIDYYKQWQYAQEEIKNQRKQLKALRAKNKILLEACEKFVKWNADYPSSQVYSETVIRQIAAKLDEICADASEAIKETDNDTK